MINDDNDMTPLAEAATNLHEVYTAYVAAGFTESQAMTLMSVMVTAMVQRTQ